LLLDAAYPNVLARTGGVAGCPARKPHRHPEGGTTEGTPEFQPASKKVIGHQ